MSDALAFLKIDHVLGLSVDEDHPGWIDVSEYEYATSGGNEGELTVTIPHDATASGLFTAVSNNETFASAVLQYPTGRSGKTRGHERRHHWQLRFEGVNVAKFQRQFGPANKVLVTLHWKRIVKSDVI